MALEAKNCWRAVEDGELTGSDQVIPTCLVFTRKRDGRFKARLVVLGNRQRGGDAAEIFAPTCSHAATRWLAIDAAANKKHIRQFDISNAFIEAVLDQEKDRLFVRLPREWSTNPNGDCVRLLKALYGLRVSPRKWFDCYRATLESLGWKMSAREPGLFTKGGLKTAIHVDDGLMTGADEKELD